MRDREETIEGRDIYKKILSFNNHKCSFSIGSLYYDDD